MKILIIGAGGFVGRNLLKSLQETSHDVVGALRDDADLLSVDSLVALLKEENPEVIVNCAGVVDNSDLAKRNVVFTSNILAAVVQSDIRPSKIVIFGSASEYAGANGVAMGEQAQIEPTSIYGTYKAEETNLALEFAQTHGLNLIVARLFNPIGLGMYEKMLIPALIRQLTAIEQEEQAAEITISRLDSKRDYIHIADVADAVTALIDTKVGNLKSRVYNIGSGVATSNEEVIRLLLDYRDMNEKVEIIETASSPEAPVATQADISRITADTDWKPKRDLTQLMKDMFDER